MNTVARASVKSYKLELLASTYLNIQLIDLSYIFQAAGLRYAAVYIWIVIICVLLCVDVLITRSGPPATPVMTSAFRASALWTLILICHYAGKVVRAVCFYKYFVC